MARSAHRNPSALAAAIASRQTQASGPAKGKFLHPEGVELDIDLEWRKTESGWWANIHQEDLTEETIKLARNIREAEIVVREWRAQLSMHLSPKIGAPVACAVHEQNGIVVVGVTLRKERKAFRKRLAQKL